ncbi:urease beta subunit [Friedmanniella endophytica]|uniref:Urease beta subunit n=1 Tax=Microlunatus kandeliicorticis TaxID=1759536 RepID=A0A7W3P693_9ACTN|nr:urease subunit beta [Microlunatus kandeliicorticis]MBA8794729.1 urease beta subunit [Microlunatus kandeliicorticis]
MAGTSSTGPGAIRLGEGDVEINADRGDDERDVLTFTNTADRPIQIGSHIHLADVNPGLAFDRERAYGFRLDIAAGTSVRFEPGASRTVPVVALRGARRVPGIQPGNARHADLEARRADPVEDEE